jgi:hypothetical protein
VSYYRKLKDLIAVKMSPEDFQLLKKAAAKKWPDAVMTNSGIVLGLAKISAKDIVRSGQRSPTMKRLPTIRQFLKGTSPETRQILEEYIRYASRFGVALKVLKKEPYFKVITQMP